MEQSERKGEVATAHCRAPGWAFRKEGKGGMADRLGGEEEARGNVVRPDDNGPSFNYLLWLIRRRRLGRNVRAEDAPLQTPTSRRNAD